MSYLFRDQNTGQMAEAIRRGDLLILPIGTTEEHGPHLPVDTDARIAEAYGQGLAAALAPELPVLLMDTIRYGYSMQIMRQWPGTLIVRARVFMDYVSDVVRSALELGFRKLVVLDCHGHHSGPLNVVAREIADLCGTAIAVISPAALSRDEFNAVRQSPAGGSIHACEWETSLVLHLAPEVVDMSQAVDEPMQYHSDFVAGDNFLGRQRVTWSTWYLQASEHGVYGTPSVATAETGKIILQAAVANGAAFLREFYARG